MRFLKGHGTGNDFVVLPDPDGELDLTAPLVRALCDRRHGIGADGVLRVVLTAAVPGALDGAALVEGADAEEVARTARWFMDYRNADGSVAEMCGNGVRVYARYLVSAGYVEPGDLVLATRGGLRSVHVPAEGDVTVEMGPPVLAEGPAVPVTVGGSTYEGTAVSMGNPHVVVRLPGGGDELDKLDLTTAPGVPDGVFPDGVNVEFVVPAGPSGEEAADVRHLAMRVHERGVGETQSCGTGACAAVVAWAHAAGRVPGDGTSVGYRLDVPGGVLGVEWSPVTVYLRGPAVLVADGLIRDEWLEAARAHG